jgi:glycopeptide antibiotics resistance protein
MIFLWLIYFKYKNKSIQNKLKFLIASLILTFGIIIEVMQLVLTNYRSFDLLDILANALGIMCGLILFLPIEKYFINKNI